MQMNDCLNQPSCNVPEHVAIIMDGNGRWAKQRNLNRILGHRAGVDAVRRVITVCKQKKVRYLTLFAFSSENWRRPAEEVEQLMDLFVSALSQEAKKLHQANLRIQFIGSRQEFHPELRHCIEQAEELTQHNTGLNLIIAANYGGQWDIAQATQKIAQKVLQGELKPEQIDINLIQAHLALADIPAPDLFIRTSGEQRISNFLIWHLAYTELLFIDKLWPDMMESDMEAAFERYSSRERRFGGSSAENPFMLSSIQQNMKETS